MESGLEVVAPQRRGWRLRVDAGKVVVLLATAILLYLVVIPVGYMVYESFTGKFGGFTLRNYADYFSRPHIVEAAINTFITAAGVAVLSVLVGVPLAFGVSRTSMAGKWLVRVSVIISILTPPFLMAMAYIILAGPNVGYLNRFLRAVFDLNTTYGPLNIFTIWGLIILTVPQGVGLVFLQVAPAMSNMDPSLEEATRIGGASPWRGILGVTLPLMKPAILSGGLLAFSISLAIYGIPHMLNINVLTVAIRESLLLGLDFKAASTLSVFVSLLSVVALFLYRASVRSARQYQTISARGFRPSIMDLGRGRHAFTAIGLLYSGFAFLLPYSTLVVTSFFKSIGRGLTLDNLTWTNYVQALSATLPRTAIKNSLLLGMTSATLVIALGLIIGYIVVRTRFPGRALLDYLAVLPVGIAGTALAVGLIIVYLNQPFSALGLYGTLGIILVAYLTRFVPVGVRNLQSALMQVSSELEEASRIGGATWGQTLRFITVPLVKGAAFYAWVLVFLQAFPELSASVLLTHIGTGVVATAILDLWDGSGGLPIAAALAVVIFSLITVFIIVGQRVSGRSGLES